MAGGARAWVWQGYVGFPIFDFLRVYSFFFFFSSRRRHTRYWRDWSSDVCSSDLAIRLRRAAASTWCWRPRVEVGWRPYYHGYWNHSRSGALVWVSSEPWGWTPYHYGCWTYEPVFGWVWLPGSSYAPAWVYWMYGPGYVGWAPMGWYDCYRPYYDWAYRPYARAGFEIGWGFYGRVHVGEIDLRPWTFVSPHHMASTRGDPPAPTTDAIRDRLRRDPG